MPLDSMFYPDTWKHSKMCEDYPSEVQQMAPLGDIFLSHTEHYAQEYEGFQ